MSCIAKIKSPVTGKTVNSPAYYQLTSFFSQAEGKKVYEAITTDTFKANFGFDWTKPHIGASTKVNYAGEPKIREINQHLKLKMSEAELQAAEQIEEIGSLGYLGETFTSARALENIGLEIQLNPKFDMIDYEVISVGDRFQLSVKPIVENSKQNNPKSISKEILEKFKFPQFVIDSVQDFNNASFKELIDNLASNAELDPFQQEILKKLSPLMSKNPTLKLALFDDINVSDEYQRSFYDPKTNTVYIAKSTYTPTDNKFLAREIIHETIHAFTLSILNNPRNLEEVQFVQELEQYFEKYKSMHSELQTYYGLKNVEEFVAEFLSNPYFREQLQVAEAQKVNSGNIIERMWNSIKGFLNRYVFGNTNSTMFDQVQETLDDYFDYLMTLQDYPESLAEHQVRFSQPFQDREQKPTIYSKLTDFYEYVEDTTNSTIWNQLSSNLGEVGGKETIELRAIKRLQDTFGKISAADINSSLIASGQFATELVQFTTRLQDDLKVLTEATSFYTPEVLLKKYNSAISIAQALREQIDGFQNNLVDQLTFATFADFNAAQLNQAAQNRLDLQKEVLNIEQYRDIIKAELDKARAAVNAIEDKARAAMLDPVAEAASRLFLKIAEDMKSPDHPIQKELAERLAEREKYERVGNKKLVANVDLEIAKLKQALGFAPTAENIKALLNSSMDQAMANENIFTRYLNVGGFSGVPIVDIVNAFITSHTIEAENDNLDKDAKIRDIEERINRRNSRKGIGRNILTSLQGSFKIKTSNLKDKYQGFFRVVPVKYYDKQGKVKIINQKVYNTPMKEIEFQNDLADLKNNLFKARRTGDADKILAAEKELESFLEDYGQRQFNDDYYEAEKLLTDDARLARQGLLNEIESYSSVFGDEDLDVLRTNSVRGSASENEPTMRDVRAAKRRAYVRLGSIYNEDGTEKPIGSKERDIAESIIAYNKARKELDVVEFVIGEETLNKFNQIKKQFNDKISGLKSQVNKLQDALDAAVIANDLSQSETIQTLIFNKKLELEGEIKKQSEWLNANSRVEILPEFFEKQQSLSDQIRDILLKYGDNPEVTEKYQRLFSAVKGFRDQDGSIQGNLVAEGLTKTIKDIEQSIEDLKKQIKKDSNISEKDKLALKSLFSALYNLQSKVNTPYYTETVNTIKYKLEADLTTEQKTDLYNQAIEEADAFMSNGNQLTARQYRLLSSDNFQADEFFVGRNAEDFESQQSDKEALVSIFNELLRRKLLNDNLRETDWYKNNHVAVTFEVKTGNTLVLPDGSTRPEMTEMTEMRPLYIWRKTIPNNEKFIKRDSPSFDWATPRIRSEYKNPSYSQRSNGYVMRPRTDGKDSKYVNEEYTKLDTEEKGIMNDILEVYDDNQRSMPDSQRLKGYIVPNMGKESKEKFRDFGRPLYKVYSAINSLKVFFRENIQGQEDEEVELDIQQAKKKLNGNKTNVRLIKTRFKQPLDDAVSTDNILGALSAYSNYAADFKGLQKALPIVFAIRDTYAAKGKQVRAKDPQDARTVWQKFKNVSGKLVQSVTGGEEVQKEIILDQIDDQIARFFHGASIRTGDSGVSKVITRLIDKITNSFQKYVLSYNPMRVPKNVTSNVLNATGNSSKFGLSKVDMLSGIAKAVFHRSELIGLQQGMTTMSPYVAKLIYFRAIPLADPTDLYRSINSSFIERYLNMDNFNAQVFGSNEAISTMGIYEAMMAKTYVPFEGANVAPGFKIKLEDAYDFIDGKLIPKDGVFGINRTRLNQLVAKKNDFIIAFLQANGVDNYNKLTTIKKVELSKKLASEFDGAIKAEENFISSRIDKLKEVEREVRDKIFQLYTSTQGNYYKRGKSYYQSVVWMKALMSMKAWLFPQASNLYGGKKFSVTTGRLDDGMYSTFLSAVRRKALGVRKQGMSLTMDYKFTEREREATQRVGWNMASATSLFVLSYYIVNSAMQALRGSGEEDDYTDWAQYLMASMALGMFDENAGMLNPIFGPALMYNKFKTDPLKKPMEEKGVAGRILGMAYVATFGQQIMTIDKILDGYGILGEAVASIPRNAKKWYEEGAELGEIGDLLDEPYYEMSADGLGYELPNPTVPYNKGKNKFLVGLSKVTGLEVGLKSMGNTGYRLAQQVKFIPAPGITNPYGELNEINSKMDKIWDNLRVKSPRDIEVIKEAVTPVFNTLTGKNEFVVNREMLKGIGTLYTMSKEDISKGINDYIELSRQKDALIDPKTGYSFLRAYEENLRVSQQIGQKDAALRDSFMLRLGGYEKPKFEIGPKGKEILKESEVFRGMSKEKLKSNIGYYDSMYKEDQDARRLIDETNRNLLPE
jgi:hypothetical protein